MKIIDKAYESEAVKKAKIDLQESMQGCGCIDFIGSDLEKRHKPEDIAKAAELLGYVIEF